MAIPVNIHIKLADFDCSLFKRLNTMETKITLSIPNKISINTNGIKLNNASEVKIFSMNQMKKKPIKNRLLKLKFKAKSSREIGNTISYFGK